MTGKTQTWVNPDGEVSKIRIQILAPYPLGQAPSQRFRFEHFLPSLEEEQIDWHFQPFISENAWKNLYKRGNHIQKALSVLSGIGRRSALMLRLRRADYILIHRELAPFGPPVFEWIIAKVLRKKIIYDFDDAIWLQDSKENILWKALKWRCKVASICRYAWKVSAGNEYLANFAGTYSSHVVVVPTVVDTSIHHPVPNQQSQKVTIGWTGSHSTLFYLNQIVPALRALQQDRAFEFVVIANKNPQLPLKDFRFIEWKKETEIKDLAQIDIGVMPLQDNAWSQGKCGFKLIQYLALGIPSVASPVGVNNVIIKDEVNGYFAQNPDQWKDRLAVLLDDSEKRRDFGRNGREFIQSNYSVASQKSNFLALFKTPLPPGA